MPFELPPLPYPDTGLEPHISAKTLSFHYGKHHAAYLKNLNALVAGTPLEGQTLEEVILAAASDPAKAGLFNNAAQTWNHSFYWQSMKPGGGGDPTGPLADQITADFGSVDKFREAFTQAGMSQFGSGWAWLAWDKKQGKLVIERTPNAGNVLTVGLVPLLTMDVWEHAYYLDYQNARPAYIKAFMALINWDFAAANFSALKK